MPWQTLCKHRTALPWRLWSIISSSSVIYIPAPLCCGKEGGETFFCFPFNCRSPDTLTCIISISQKKDFLPLLFKNEISRRRRALLQLLSLKTMFTLQEGEDEKQVRCFFKCRRRALQFLKGNSTALTDIIQWDLWWGFQNAVKAFGAGVCGAPLWVAAAGTD